jgi:hypothetical protein
MFVMADRAEAEALENLIRINCAIAAGSAAKTARVSRSDRPSSSDLGRSRCCLCVGIIFAAKGG